MAENWRCWESCSACCDASCTRILRCNSSEMQVIRFYLKLACIFHLFQPFYAFLCYQWLCNPFGSVDFLWLRSYLPLEWRLILSNLFQLWFCKQMILVFGRVSKSFSLSLKIVLHKYSCGIFLKRHAVNRCWKTLKWYNQTIFWQKQDAHEITLYRWSGARKRTKTRCA